MIRYCIVFLLLLSANASLAQQQIIRDLSVQQFKSSLDSLSDEVLIDLRTPDELKGGIIENATQLDYFRKDFESAVAKLDTDKSYFLYCEVGGRSGETMELMQKLGFKRVYHLKDGFKAWKKYKMPIEVMKNNP